MAPEAFDAETSRSITKKSGFIPTVLNKSGNFPISSGLKRDNFKDPNILLVHEGCGSISGARDFINAADFPREFLSIRDPKKVGFRGGIRERAVTVLFAGKAILVLLKNKAGEQILKSADRVKFAPRRVDSQKNLR
jgi:hypothetical protein